jgi:AcrR family transcriptional regulator
VESKNITRKEKERLLRQNAILEAAVGFFASKGFRDTTLEEIALAAEFGKGTIYNYFDSKEDIYSAIIDDVSTNLYKIIKQADSGSVNAVEFFVYYSKLLFQYCFDNQDAIKVYIREVAHFTTDIFITDRTEINKRHDRVQNLLIKKMGEGIKNKEFKKFDKEKLSTVFEHLIFPYILHLINCCYDDKLDEGKEIEFILSVFFNGIINKSKQVKL